jgi:3-(3-hydroxy-phenyl)propionate hydroxylase
LAALDEPNTRLAGRLSGLDIHYDLGDGHPLLGRRMPDLDVVTTDGSVRVFELLHEAMPVLLDLGEQHGLGVARGWADRVRTVAASYEAAWELPVLATVTAPQAVLVRPDGHVAWVGDGTDAGLADALTTWFGPSKRIASRPAVVDD